MEANQDTVWGIINIKPSKTEFAEIEFGFYYASRKEESGLHTFYIPAFEICFSVEDKKQGEGLVPSAVSAFARYWILNKGLDAFLMKIRAMGFMPEKDFWLNTIKQKQIFGVYKIRDIKFPQSFSPIKEEVRYHEIKIAA